MNVLLPLLLIMIASAPAPARTVGSLDFYFVDVEGGAATLIVTPSHESVLIDCGAPGPRDAARIKVAADAAGIKQIDHLIATHWHSDHFGGTPDLARLMPIRHFYNRGFNATPVHDEPKLYPQMMAAYVKASHGKSVTLKPGDTVPVRQTPGDPKLTILCLCGDKQFLPDSPNAPKNTAADEYLPLDPDPSDNARSLGFRLSYGGFRFLDLGDLTWNMEANLVRPTDKIGLIDVYQSTHHGLDISNNPVVIKTVNPRVAVYNNGPHKGGSVDLTMTLRNLPEPPTIFQLHRNLDCFTTDNAPADCIANAADPCQGEFIHLVVAADGKSYTVTVGRHGTARRFLTRNP